MDWAAVTRSEWISAAAVAIALLSAFYTWRNFRLSARKERREIEATKPVFEHFIDWFQGPPTGFFRIKIIVRNRAAHGLVIDKLTAAVPGALKLVDDNALPDDGTGNRRGDIEARSRALRDSVDAALYVPPHEHIVFFVTLKPLAAGPVAWLQFDLSERLPTIRRSRTMLQIKVPAEIIKAMIESQSDGESGGSHS